MQIYLHICEKSSTFASDKVRADKMGLARPVGEKSLQHFRPRKGWVTLRDCQKQESRNISAYIYIILQNRMYQPKAQKGTAHNI